MHECPRSRSTLLVMRTVFRTAVPPATGRARPLSSPSRNRPRCRGVRPIRHPGDPNWQPFREVGRKGRASWVGCSADTARTFSLDARLGSVRIQPTIAVRALSSSGSKQAHGLLGHSAGMPRPRRARARVRFMTAMRPASHETCGLCFAGHSLPSAKSGTLVFGRAGQFGGEAMRTVRHAPPYVMEIAGQWRVVVPVRGKLTPRVCADFFSSRQHAEAWLASEEGHQTTAEIRERRAALTSRNDQEFRI
jgi:hypothetical protein